MTRRDAPSRADRREGTPVDGQPARTCPRNEDFSARVCGGICAVNSQRDWDQRSDRMTFPHAAQRQFREIKVAGKPTQLCGFRTEVKIEIL